MKGTIIGLDPGSAKSGVCVLENMRIVAAFDEVNELVLARMTHWLLRKDCIVVIEDIAAYAGTLKPQVIDTAKFIGECCYRLKSEVSVDVELIPRSTVKQWVFNTFGEVVIPMIDNRIDKKAIHASDVATKERIKLFPDGKLWKARKASFVYCDDRCVTKAMKHYYEIEDVKRGKKQIFGLSEHSFQALAVATLYANKNQHP